METRPVVIPCHVHMHGCELPRSLVSRWPPPPQLACLTVAAFSSCLASGCCSPSTCACSRPRYSSPRQPRPARSCEQHSDWISDHATTCCMQSISRPASKTARCDRDASDPCHAPSIVVISAQRPGFTSVSAQECVCVIGADMARCAANTHGLYDIAARSCTTRQSSATKTIRQPTSKVLYGIGPGQGGLNMVQICA